jgi:hypothetical protein
VRAEGERARKFMQKTYPEASCFKTNLFWPSQGKRSAWIVTLCLIDSMPFASAENEEWAWEKAAMRLYLDQTEAIHTRLSSAENQEEIERCRQEQKELDAAFDISIGR